MHPQTFEFQMPTAMILLNRTTKKKFSNLAENGTNRPEDIKSGPNLVSDEKVDFSQKSQTHRNFNFNPAQPQLEFIFNPAQPQMPDAPQTHGSTSKGCVVLLWATSLVSPHLT